MMQALRITSMVLIVMTIWSVPAKADIWDWLEQLSGPGPFNGRGKLPESATATIYCHGFDSGSGWLRLLNRADARGPCVFADVHNFEAPDDERFFRVRATLTEFGPTYRIAPPVEVGIGVGLIRFNSTGKITDRMTISFPRVVFKPLLLVPSLQEKRKGNWGFIQMYFRETHILGKLNQDDFRPQRGTTFHTDEDMVASTGILIDVVGLTRLILNK